MGVKNQGAKTVDDLTRKNIAPLVGLVKRFDGRANSSEWADAMHTETSQLGHHRRVLQGLGLIEPTGEEVPVEDAPPNVTAKVFEVTDKGREVANAHADDIVLPMPPDVMADEIRSLRQQVRRQDEQLEEMDARLEEMTEKFNNLVDVVEKQL